jgi:hypothetical protein
MNAIDDDECTALVRKPVYTKRWGEIVYISGHQDTGNWAGGMGPLWLLCQAWSCGSNSAEDGGMFSKEQTINW